MKCAHCGLPTERYVQVLAEIVKVQCYSHINRIKIQKVGV